MTCIVAVADKGRVHIGGDSAGSAGVRLAIRSDEKVFIRDQFIIGFTSSFRMGQILRYRLSVPGKPEGMDDTEYMSTWFIDGVRSVLKTYGFAETVNGNESGGVFIVGYRGQIFTVEGDYQVGKTPSPWAAVGCGESWAMGALHALADRPGLKPRERITRALDAACAHSGAVAPPYTILDA